MLVFVLKYFVVVHWWTENILDDVDYGCVDEYLCYISAELHVCNTVYYEASKLDARGRSRSFLVLISQKVRSYLKSVAFAEPTNRQEPARSPQASP